MAITLSDSNADFPKTSSPFLFEICVKSNLTDGAADELIDQIISGRISQADIQELDGPGLSILA